MSRNNRGECEDLYLVYIDDAIVMPSFAELEREFGKGHISDIFDGRPFERHSSCGGSDNLPGERLFLLRCYGYVIEGEAAIAEMDKRRYHPASHVQAYLFCRANPELQLQFRIGAPGTFACKEVFRHAAVFCDAYGRPCLDDHCMDRPWFAGDRLLFVKTSI